MGAHFSITLKIFSQQRNSFNATENYFDKSKSFHHDHLEVARMINRENNGKETDFGLLRYTLSPGAILQ